MTIHESVPPLLTQMKLRIQCIKRIKSKELKHLLSNCGLLMFCFLAQFFLAEKNLEVTSSIFSIPEKII